MVKHNTEHIDDIFQALADSTRRNILMRLAQKEHSVSEIAEPYEMSLAAVSKHLKVLERAGLIVKRKEGRSNRCRMNYKPLDQVAALIREYRQFWEGQLEELEKFINKTKQQGD